MRLFNDTTAVLAINVLNIKTLNEKVEIDSALRNDTIDSILS